MGHEPPPRRSSARPAEAVACASHWPELDQLVSELLAVRREIARQQAAEARLLAHSVDLMMARMAQRRAAGEHMADPDLPLREVSLELGMAFRVSDRTVHARMGDAHQLVSEFAATHAAWADGRIDAGHAWAISRAGLGISSQEDRVRFEALALEVAKTESPARMTAAAKAIAATVAPHDFADRVRRAADDRMVRVYELPDGLARLIADLPAALAYGIRDRLSELAKSALAAEADEHAESGDAGATGLSGREGGGDGAPDAERAGGDPGDPAFGTDRVCGVNDGSAGGRVFGGAAAAAAGVGAARDDDGDAGRAGPDALETGPSLPRRSDGARPRRTLEQARADVLADLLLAGVPATLGEAAAAITGHVHVTVPAATLAGTGAEPALLAGYGPIDLDSARALAGHATAWTRVFTDPMCGTAVAVDRYRPSAELRRLLIARDERCRAPGCVRAALRCDLDHTHDAAKGGATAVDNLSHLCRRHHTVKHHTAWRVRQRPGGVIEWTAPTGRRYRDRPPAAVRFVPRASSSAEGAEPRALREPHAHAEPPPF